MFVDTTCGRGTLAQGFQNNLSEHSTSMCTKTCMDPILHVCVTLGLGNTYKDYLEGYTEGGTTQSFMVPTPW